MLHGAAENYARPALPGGCLTINSAVTVTPANHHIAERLTQLRNANVDKIAAVFDADVRSRVLPKNTPSRTLATYLGTVVQGMSQQARDGANAEQLHRIAEMGLFTITSVVAPPTPRAK